MRPTVDPSISAEDLAEVLIDHEAPVVELARKLADYGMRITYGKSGFHIGRIEPIHLTLIDITRSQA